MLRSLPGPRCICSQSPHSSYGLVDVINSFGLELLRSVVLGAEERSHRAVTHGLWALDLPALHRDEMFTSEKLKSGQMGGAEHAVKEEEAPWGSFTCGNPCLGLQNTSFGATKFISIPGPTLIAKGGRFGIQASFMECK